MGTGGFPKWTAPASSDLSDPSYLLHLLRCMEVKLFTELGKKMMAAGKAGTFNTWMLQESDLIQNAARSFGERLIAERFTEDLKPILTQVFKLFVITLLEKNSAMFASSGLIG